MGETNNEAEDQDCSWLTPEFFVEAYRRYALVRWTTDYFPDNDIFDLRATEIRFPVRTADFQLWLDTHLIGGGLNVLMGEVNSYYNDLCSVRAREAVLAQCPDEDQRLQLAVEFPEHPAWAALNAPQAMKDNLVLIATKIGLFWEPGKEAPIRPDYKINLQGTQRDQFLSFQVAPLLSS